MMSKYTFLFFHYDLQSFNLYDQIHRMNQYLRINIIEKKSSSIKLNKCCCLDNKTPLLLKKCREYSTSNYIKRFLYKLCHDKSDKIPG